MAVSLRAGLPEISTAFVIFARRACYSIGRCIHRPEGETFLPAADAQHCKSLHNMV
ncbi:hypothetical protein EP10_003470 [Geobacillus icigianus]|uniref:Uncharacterized protein n=1 Tax=Geobacillus icigianus TaxID=1430331 RepID=A0ABU6BKL6_9BACL|nr:hypothetical protein [Geobacillus icigianus]